MQDRYIKLFFYINGTHCEFDFKRNLNVPVYPSKCVLIRSSSISQVNQDIFMLSIEDICDFTFATDYSCSGVVLQICTLTL